MTKKFAGQHPAHPPYGAALLSPFKRVLNVRAQLYWITKGVHIAEAKIVGFFSLERGKRDLQALDLSFASRFGKCHC